MWILTHSCSPFVHLHRTIGMVAFVASCASAMGTIIYSDDFSSEPLGGAPAATTSLNGTIVDGSATTADGQALQLSDPGTSGSTADKVSYFESNFAADSSGEFRAVNVSFDLYNNEPSGAASSFIFGLGHYDASTSPRLNATASRFLNLEFGAATSSLTVRTALGNLGSVSYQLGASNSIELFINDSDTESITFIRPDNLESTSLGSNAFALFVNDAAFGENSLGGLSLDGDSGLGRLGFYSGTSVISDFTIDNIQVSDLAPSAVPEPSTYAFLAGLGSLGMLALRRMGRAGSVD